MQLRATTHETDGITLVSLVVRNDSAEPRRFRVANRLDGPVWAPRVHGITAPGWDEAGYEGVLAPGGTRPLGYATTGSPADPPAELVWSEPAGESEPEGTSPEAILRSFGDPRPPADVVVPDYLADEGQGSDDGETP
ncbi:MAG: hypothetical protein ACQEQY_05315 [Halobacteriota archaeon]